MFNKLRAGLGLFRRRVALSTLTWNSKELNLSAVDVLIVEAERLRERGQTPLLIVCDNGSTDGTQETLRELDHSLELEHQFILNDENLGISIARNQIIEAMQAWDADYLLLNDGDIEIVPSSTYAMVQYLESEARSVAGIGPYSFGFTENRAEMTPELQRIDLAQIEKNVSLAATHYGLFRREIFEDGVRFETQSPFGGPGWGYEDNDFAFQILTSGYQLHQFTGMTFYHPHMRSSVDHLRESGFDPRALCERRKQFVIDKWNGTPLIDDGPLDLIRTSSTEI